MVQPVFLAFGLFLTLVKETHRRKEHVLWGPGVQVPAEMGSAQKGSGLEWRQGCWFVPLVSVSLAGAVLLTRSIGLLSMRAWQRRGG